MDNYKDGNSYITEYLSPPEEETNTMQEPMKEEIVETGSSLDENEKESDEQKGEEWISYPCLPSNESNSLTHTLFDYPPAHLRRLNAMIILIRLKHPFLIRMILLYMIIRAILINPMLILYLFLTLRCMIMKSCA